MDIDRMRIFRFTSHLYGFLRFSGIVLVGIIFLGTQQVQAWQPGQKKLWEKNIDRFDIAACSAPAAAEPTGSTPVNNIYMIGDSISVLAYFITGDLKQAIKDKGWTMKINANGGRGMEYGGSDPRSDPPNLPGVDMSGLDALKADHQAIKEADTVVVALGTNESNVDLSANASANIFKEQMNKAITEIQNINDLATIYWVNISADVTHPYTPYVKEYNEVISSVGTNRGIQVIDTTDQALDNDISLSPDGIHPDPAGLKTWSKVIADSLGTTSGTSLPVGCCAAGAPEDVDAALAGKDNEGKTWNYFKGKGLSDEQTAGIMGNIEQESHFDPQIMQIGGRSKNPEDAGELGWGIIQWSPGGKVLGLLEDSDVEGEIYLLKTQLDLVWAHMHNDPVVTQPFDMNHFKTIKNEVDAAVYFGEKIEGFGEAGDRWQDATDMLNKYKGTEPEGGLVVGGGSGSGSNGCTIDNSVSPECASAQGNTKILCEARKYDVVSYVWGGGHAGGKAYHQACKNPNTGNACGLDCSGLVSVAVYDAFGGSGTLAWDTNSLRADTKNWKQISFNEALPGDVMEPDAGHVEIVDHISGNTVHTFGAHSDSYPQPRQVGPSSYTNSGSLMFFRYIGEGSS